jgi:hypothetical protein
MWAGNIKLLCELVLQNFNVGWYYETFMLASTQNFNVGWYYKTFMLASTQEL